MRPTNKIANTHEEEMSLILKFILDFDVNKLLYAINGKRLREEDIINVTINIRDYYNKLSHQKIYLFRFGEVFNKLFTTDNNKCFDTSLKVSRKMRSAFSGIKKAIFKPFVKVSRKRLPDGTPNPTILDRSMISTENYCADLYGLASYPECVKELFRVMLDFYELVDECIAECTRIINEEKVLKTDSKRCLKLLNEACEKSKKAQCHIIETIVKDSNFRELCKNNAILQGDALNPVLRDFKKNSMSESFAQTYLHNCTPSDIGKITIFSVSKEAEEDPMRTLAHAVFGNDDEKIDKINYIIIHFDNLLPNICKRGKIPAYHMFVFMEWCGHITSVLSFLNYFDKYYHLHGGKWKVVGISAINGAKNKPYKDHKKSCEQIKDNMLKGIDSLLQNYTAKK